MNTRLTQYCVISHDAPAEKVVQVWGQVWIDDVVLNGLHYKSFPTDNQEANAVTRKMKDKANLWPN